MKGYIKCDICGKFYKEFDAERYDGLTAFYYSPVNGARTMVEMNKNIIETDGSDSDIPASMDMCTDCFNRFVDWAKMCKEDSRRGLK